MKIQNIKKSNQGYRLVMNYIVPKMNGKVGLAAGFRARTFENNNNL